jgi:GNAT superfamily N-acetyltransferase
VQLVIREARDDDAPGVVELLNEVHPTWIHTEAGWLHWRAAEPERAHRLTLVAEEDGRLVGLGGGAMHYEAERADAAWVGVSVRERSRGRGIGRRLYARAEAHVVSRGGRRLLTMTHDDDASRHFAESRGFRHTLSERVSAVDPREVDLSGLAALTAAKADEGFCLLPMSDVGAEDVFRVDVESTRDVPMDEPIGEIRFDEWERRYWRHPNISREASRVVVRDGQTVAFAMLYVDRRRGKAANEMTGTLRQFRGRKLARLAKLGTIAWAVENGITQILTGNDETNAPMLAINVSLGYRPIATELSWVRDVE